MKEMRLMPQGKSEKAWFWNGLITDSSTKSQQAMFAVKFQTSDEAKEFYQQFMLGVTAAEAEVNKSMSNC